MFCPQCLADYREGFYTCMDCGASLVSELQPEHARECLDFEEILVSLSASDMAMIKSVLDCEGITYYFVGESPFCLDPIRLVVREDQADEVRQILTGLKLSGPPTGVESESKDGE